MPGAADALERARSSPSGAFWTLERAAAPGSRTTGGPSGPLRDATVAVKDCFDVVGLPTTCGVAREWAPARSDATAVRRLRDAGALPLGKAAMDQLAWSTYALAPGFPPCRNPVDPALSPGGSSCGPAAAVAEGQARLGLGTDDAGSIRIPAACCGVVGLKPPSGWIPLAGAAAFAPTFDCGGVIARSLDDCVLAVEAIAGRRFPGERVSGARVVLLEDLLELADAAVASAVENAAQALAGAGAELSSRRLAAQPPPGMGKVLALELEQTWGESVRQEPELYGEEVQSSIAYGERLSAQDRVRARQELAEGRRALERALEGCTATLAPTLLWPAPPAADHPSVAEMTRCTRPFNLLDWAALSLPVGSEPPIGIQLAAPAGSFGELVGLARVLSG